MFRFILLLVSFWSLSVVLFAQDQPAAGKLALVIVEGEGATNNIKLRTSREMIVQVEDENHRPVAGAVVSFALPQNGAGGIFANGGKSLVATTDASGRASATFQPNQVAGRFEIRVTASSQGRQGSLTVSQTNTAGANVPNQHRFLNAKMLGIVGGAAGAVGICRAAHCGGWGSGAGGNAIAISQIQIR
jgi:hypothetical protein